MWSEIFSFFHRICCYINALLGGSNSSVYEPVPDSPIDTCSTFKPNQSPQISSRLVSPTPGELPWEVEKEVAQDEDVDVAVLENVSQTLADDNGSVKHETGENLLGPFSEIVDISQEPIEGGLPDIGNESAADSREHLFSDTEGSSSVAIKDQLISSLPEGTLSLLEEHDSMVTNANTKHRLDTLKNDTVDISDESIPTLVAAEQSKHEEVFVSERRMFESETQPAPHVTAVPEPEPSPQLSGVPSSRQSSTTTPPPEKVEKHEEKEVSPTASLSQSKAKTGSKISNLAGKLGSINLNAFGPPPKHLLNKSRQQTYADGRDVSETHEEQGPGHHAKLLHTESMRVSHEVQQQLVSRSKSLLPSANKSRAKPSPRVRPPSSMFLKNMSSIAVEASTDSNESSTNIDASADNSEAQDNEEHSAQESYNNNITETFDSLPSGEGSVKPDTI